MMHETGNLRSHLGMAGIEGVRLFSHRHVLHVHEIYFWKDQQEQFLVLCESLSIRVLAMY